MRPAVSRPSAEASAPREPVPDLDDKDLRILTGLSEGRSISLIARECGLSTRQVSRRIAAMSARLDGAANATQLVYLAVRRGLI